MICAGLNIIGGYSWHNARRFIMPVILTVAVSLIVHSWWTGLPCLLGIAPLCIGYGEKSLLWKYFNDAWGRFVWMILVGIALGLGLVISHHLSIWVAVIYVIGNGILGITLRKLNQFFSDAIFGIGLSSFILFVR